VTGIPRECAAGAPCWVTLTARDLDTATGFYGPLLGWRFEPAPERWGRHLRVVVGDEAVAGIGEVARQWEFAVAWTTYFATDDADRTADGVRERGGTVAVGPLDFDAGRLAVAADPHGAVFGLWEGARPPYDVRRPLGAPAWLQLRTQDAFDAAIFYGGLLHWDDAPDPERYDVVWEHDRVVLRVDGHATAALAGGGTPAATDPRLRPRWHVYFSVADVDAALRTAVDLGGEVTGEPENSAYGRVAGVRDPEGGLFSLISRVD
jgi:uncharacterized protein